MIDSVVVIGARGRVGSAMSARLCERGVALLDAGDADQVIVSVPARANGEVAAEIEAGPWVAHVSGGKQFSALAPHERRFSLHPLQTFTLDRGPEQLDGAWAAVTGETDEAVATAKWLATTLGLQPFVLADERRTLYHAGAAIASNYLVTLRVAAGALFEASAVPPEALEPLMRRVIDNGFQLTGPIERGDWETVERHRAAIAEAAPDLLPAYDALATLTARDTVSQGSRG
jgi:predicted short-subunit dehydrogenase-like oxidoreductase (DUF2520 family)